MKKIALLIVLVISLNAYTQTKPSNAKFIELNYSLNTPYKFGHTKSIQGRVIVTRRGDIKRYIVIVSGNNTYKIWIADKRLFELIKTKDFLVLKNCTYL